MKLKQFGTRNNKTMTLQRQSFFLLKLFIGRWTEIEYLQEQFIIQHCQCPLEVQREILPKITKTFRN